jgi:hypothetical protein
LIWCFFSFFFVLFTLWMFFFFLVFFLTKKLKSQIDKQLPSLQLRRDPLGRRDGLDRPGPGRRGRGRRCGRWQVQGQGHAHGGGAPAVKTKLIIINFHIFLSPSPPPCCTVGPEAKVQSKCKVNPQDFDTVGLSRESIDAVVLAGMDCPLQHPFFHGCTGASIARMLGISTATRLG